MALTSEKRDYWRSTMTMLQGEAHRKRCKMWRDLKKRYRADLWTVAGLDPNSTFRIPRMYKLVRESIASLSYRYPHIFLKVENDPADEQSGQELENSGPILEDFLNDAMEVMTVKPVAQQLTFDGLFCGRFFAGFGYVTVSGEPMDAYQKGVLPYVGSDLIDGDFTYVYRIPPEYALVDPLTPPENFYAGEYFGEIQYAPIEHLIDDPSFSNVQTQLRGLRNTIRETRVTTPVIGKSDEEWEDMDDDKRGMLMEAHRLRGVRKLVRITDRRNQRRITFIDGIDEEAEDVPHPFLADMVEYRPDPMTGRPLLARANPETGTVGTRVRKRWLVHGGMPYYSGAFDASDDFWPDPKMAYENPIQNALTRSVTRRLDRLNMFLRHPIVKKSEWDENQVHIKKVIEGGVDGQTLVLNDINSIKELNWGSNPNDTNQIEQDLLRYESDTLRISSNASQEKLATGKALAAADAELNRELDQAPIEDFWVWTAKNTMSVLSDDRFTPQNFLLRLTSQQGSQRIQLALQSWHLRGKFNISIAAGSMNVLYEQLQQDKAIQFYDRAVASPNFDRLKLDKYLARAHGNVDAETLLRDDANVDAAKAAALEVEMMIAFALNQYDPGVTQGEAHGVHISLQGPEQVQAHPQFANLQPALQQSVAQIAAAHIEQHQQMMLQEQGGGSVARGSASGGGVMDLIGQVQSNAQQTQDAVSQSAERTAR